MFAKRTPADSREITDFAVDWVFSDSYMNIFVTISYLATLQGSGLHTSGEVDTL